MNFTTLRVNENGVLLFEQHEERFRSAGLEAVKAYRQFAADSAPGIYNLYWDKDTMQIKTRGESRLFDEMPVRFKVSPLVTSAPQTSKGALMINTQSPFGGLGYSGSIEKPMPPNVYTNLIEPGVATLLTSANGKEIYESCSASVIAWNGEQIIMVPEDRPRVKSTMEELLREYQMSKEKALVSEEPIMKDSDYPIALINAVKCICTLSVEGRKPFPEEIINNIKKIYDMTARRT